jgi:uncharacterized protein
LSPDPAVDPELMEILACPHCRGAVREADSALRCEECGRSYPIRSVPVMLVEESTPGA